MSVLKVYQEVIDDVVSAVRELFLEDGVDEQVLQELKQTWESKLMATKAVVKQSEPEKPNVKKSGELSNSNIYPKLPPQVVKQVVGQVAPNNHVQTQSVAQVLDTKTVPIQITLPSQPGTNLAPRVLTIQVPAAALQDNQLDKIGHVISATMHLPPAIATYVLQNHVNATYAQMGNSNHQSNHLSAMLSAPTGTHKTVIQNDGADDHEDELELNAPSCSKAGTNNIKLEENDRKLFLQIDGHDETTDDDEDGSEDDEPSDDNDDDKDDEDNEMDDGGPEEEPLNSEDDVTDEDPGDLFETDNVVVCQYDKITRSRNKWKFHLKDGIMNLNGEDYVFQKANGDAEW